MQHLPGKRSYFYKTVDGGMHRLHYGEGRRGGLRLHCILEVADHERGWRGRLSCPATSVGIHDRDAESCDVTSIYQLISHLRKCSDSIPFYSIPVQLSCVFFHAQEEPHNCQLCRNCTRHTCIRRRETSVRYVLTKAPRNLTTLHTVFNHGRQRNTN